MIVRSSRAVSRAGFTLMEVLVVVAILVILAGTGGVIYMQFQKDAYKDVARTQVETLTKAAQSYAVKHGSEYPASLAALVQEGYLEEKALIDPWNHEYHYQYPGTHNQARGKPDIWSDGPNDGSGMIGNWTIGQQ